ncbi:PREDICTED: nijmegen breakage syndrome 1 protein isoform X2 [Nelumbo nucifera]|uniref:Nijmegen breakage syndrome 1 protein isoform X2 n=1 Tax=Nelumbo nucifera TaxID=4432 RepID=A0A1U7ZNM7_NELNU|nr:PREDICTED: nijmegen breakage syndrome 1 protein isoform X2 [Nelumbo nucifera]
MVWGLFPAESLPGEQKYFIYSKGAYKVGRKGCDVIINTDKGVSRIHAEIIVDAMTSFDPHQNRPSGFPLEVRIRDCSKYGTFINKKLGKGAKVHEHPNKEMTLKDGDLVSFGTGAFATCNWTPECTHVLVDESAPVKEELLEAVMARRPVILGNWVEVVSQDNIRSEIPSCSLFVPTLMFEGMPIKIVDPKHRENCLAGHTFLLGSLNLYIFGSRLQSLLDVCGAKALSIDDFCSSSQASEDGDNFVLIIPTGSVNKFDHFHHLRSLSRITDTNLVCAILSGHLDPSVVVPPSLLVSSSCSTDETIVADSDVEVDTSASDHVTEATQSEEAIRHEVKGKISVDHAYTASQKVQSSSFRTEGGGIIITKSDKLIESETSENQNSDVIFSQDLVVIDAKAPASVSSMTKTVVVNFKCFRKRETQSGNSFKDLIPFSKYPYNESDYGSEVAEYVKAEKKQKQMEAIAEDLFNNEKKRRRGPTGPSIREFLTRG